jgi:hypothetical protein
MSLKTKVPGRKKLQDITFVANEDLSAVKNTVVVPAGAVSAGPTKVGKPGGQGVLALGVLENEPESGQAAEVAVQGRAKIKSASTFNAGVEITVAGTAGTIEAAASGDYVVGIALEASAEAGQLVACLLTGQYQKN